MPETQLKPVLGADGARGVHGSAVSLEARGRMALRAAAALIVTVLAVVELVKGGQDDQLGAEDPIALVVFSAISIGVAALLLLRVIPAAGQRGDAAERLPRLALALGAAAAACVVVAWSGLPLALGAAAIVAGLTAGDLAVGRPRPATVGLALGALAITGSLVVAVIG